VLGRIGAVETGTAEHQGDVMMLNVLRDAAPEQLHRLVSSVAYVHAGPADLHDLVVAVQQPVDVVLVLRVEPSDPRRARAPQEPVGAHHGFRPAAERMVDDQQMLAMLVEPIRIEPQTRRFAGRLCRHLLVEDPVPEGLRGLDLGRALGQPDLHGPNPDGDGRTGTVAGRLPVLLRQHRPKQRRRHHRSCRSEPRA